MNIRSLGSSSVIRNISIGILFAVTLSDLGAVSRQGQAILVIAAPILMVFGNGLVGGLSVFYASLAVHAAIVALLKALGVGVFDHRLLWVLFALIVTSVGGVEHRRVKSKVAHYRTSIKETLIVVGAWLCLRQLDLSSLSQRLEFLSPEDNAEWLSTVATMTEAHRGALVDGASGYVVGPFTQLLLPLTSDSFSKDVGLAINILTNAYLFTILCASVVFALVLTQVNDVRVGRIGLGVVTPLVPLVAVNMLQIPVQRGHLTFLLAVTFVWLTILALISIPSVSNKSHFVTSALVAGVALSWWPVFPVVICSIGVLFSQQLVQYYRVCINRRRAQRSIVLGSLFLFGVVTLWRNIDLTMSLRNFLTTLGGIDAPQSQVVLLSAFLAVYTLTRSHWRIAVLPSFILVYGLILTVMSTYIGPTYTPGYSSQKVLLLAVMCISPLIAPALHTTMSAVRIELRLAVFLLALLVFWLTVPGIKRVEVMSQATRSWSNELVEVLSAQPELKIVCYSGSEEREMEAYLCSRLSSALSAAESPWASGWRHLLMFGETESPENRGVFENAERWMNSYLSSPVRVIFVGDQKQVSIEDAWWFRELSTLRSAS